MQDRTKTCHFEWWNIV